MGKKTLLKALIPAILALPLMMSAKVPAVTPGEYYPDFGSFEEEQAAAAELNFELYKESLTLLKNDGTLPLRTEKAVTVFGVGGVNTRAGGGGSGSSGSDPNATIAWTLEHNGYKVNHRVLDVTRSLVGSANDQEIDPKLLEPAYGSYAQFGDAAFVVLTRPGSEFSDNKSYQAPGHADQADHILCLQDNEKKMIAHAEENFDKVIILVNSAAAMELGELENDPKVNSILWIGYGGYDGIKALGEVIRGTDTPTGRTVDIYPADFKKDPTWTNFSDNTQVGAHAATADEVATNNAKEDSDPTKIRNLKVGDLIKGPNRSQVQGKDAENNWNTSYTKAKGAAFTSAYNEIQYKEGIYMGYRYYETAATNAEYDYDEAVVYPFGYGLSYTTFEWDNANLISQNVGVTSGKATGSVKFSVDVENTGSVASKDVVEIYLESPYTPGGIEKPKVALVDYQKTKLLAAGETQTLTFDIKAADLASFDYNDANGNGHQGYELEAGDYKLWIVKNSHGWADPSALSVSFNLAEAGQITKSASDGEIHAYFSQTKAPADDNITTGSGKDADWRWYNTNKLNIQDGVATEAVDYLSRQDLIATAGAVPAVPAEEELHYNADALAYLNGIAKDWAYEDLPTDPWYVEAVPETWKQAAEEDVLASGNTLALKEGVTLESRFGKDTLLSLRGKSFDDPAWEAFMNKLTVKEMVAAINGNSRRRVNIDTIGLPRGYEDDGPAQLKNSGKRINGFAWICEVNIASTWNPELAYKQGVMVGNDSLFIGCTGWYGPACNTHRSPLAGRNFEYYSQDGVQAGKLVQNVVKGAVEKGVHVYLKHFVLNDQEQNRTTTGGLITYCNEQALREIYLKPWQMAVENGHLNGTMAAFNRVGLHRTVNWPLYRGIMENEWGFFGVSDTDIGSNGFTGVKLTRCHVYPMGSQSKDGYMYEGEYDKANNKFLVANDPAKVVEGDASTQKISSPTAWYNLRTTSQLALYHRINTNEGLNGVSFRNFQTVAGRDEFDFEGVQGKAASGWKVSMSDEDLGTKFDGEGNLVGRRKVVTYSVVGGELPAGVTLNSSTGALSGTPSEPGTFSATIEALVDGFISGTATYKFKIDPGFAISAASGRVGTAFEGTVAPVAGTTYASQRNATYSLAEGAVLPEGLSLASDGKVSGTPLQTGKFEVDMVFTYTSGSGSRARTYNIPFSVVITIEEDPDAVLPPTIEEQLAELSGKIDALTAKVEALETSSTGNAEEIAAAKAQLAELTSRLSSLSESDAAEIAALKTQIADLTAKITALESAMEKKADKGCGSAVGLSVLAISGVALAGLALALKKRKEDK